MSKDNKKIATLWDRKNSNDEDHDDHNHGQAFYAGGSEHSGQEILGPRRDGPESSDRFIENLFNHAQRSASSVRDSDSQPPAGSSTLPVIFWRNGFTVGEDSELRDYRNPENMQFLDYIKRGDTPPELASRVRGGMIDVSLTKRTHLDYKPVRKPFSGAGHRLGTVVPEMIQGEQSASSEPTNQSTNIQSSLVLDETKPSTTVQVRLADNSRLVVKVNLTNRVGEIVSHIRSMRPQYSETNFVLATTYPAKELTDLEQTVESAKLANASVLQKIKSSF